MVSSWKRSSQLNYAIILILLSIFAISGCRSSLKSQIKEDVSPFKELSLGDAVNRINDQFGNTKMAWKVSLSAAMSITEMSPISPVGCRKMV